MMAALSPPPSRFASRPRIDSQLEDDELAQWASDAARGDREAARRLFDAVSPIFLAAARRTVGSGNPEIEDFVQEASLKFFRSLPAFRGESRVRRYAYKIATHLSADWIRGKQALKRSRVRDEIPEHVAGREDPARDLARARLAHMLERSLSTEQLETFLMRNALDCTIAEIADTMGVPENTVRSRLRLAKENLKRVLAVKPSLLTHWGGPHD